MKVIKALMHEPQNLTFSIAESSGDVGQPPFYRKKRKKMEDGKREEKKRTTVNQVQTTSACVFSQAMRLPPSVLSRWVCKLWAMGVVLNGSNQFLIYLNFMMDTFSFGEKSACASTAVHRAC